MCLTLSKLNIMDTSKLYDMHAVTIDVASETGLHTRRLCKSCAVDFQKLKVQCRTLTCCFLVISVFLSSLIVANAIITLNIRERLLQIEIKNELLENKVESLEERLESIRFPKSDSLVTTNTGDITEIVTRNDDRKDEYQLLSRSKRQARHEGAKGKKNNKSGKGKRCKNCLPAVQIEGTGGYGSQTSKTDLTGKWATPDWISATDKQSSKLFDTTTVNRNGHIKVTENGLYLVYAQMTLFGQNKKGYYVKKEPNKSSIASCTYYSDSGTDYNGTSCSTMKLVNLNKGDFLYVEEIDGNSKALYSDLTAVFGLVRIGSLQKM